MPKITVHGGPSDARRPETMPPPVREPPAETEPAGEDTAGPDTPAGTPMLPRRRAKRT